MDVVQVGELMISVTQEDSEEAKDETIARDQRRLMVERDGEAIKCCQRLE